MPLPARLAFVDLETTGLSRNSDCIIEVGVVTVDGDRVEEMDDARQPARPQALAQHARYDSERLRA